MAFRIKNISHQLLVVTLNSGKTVHLAPAEVSEPMEEVEIKGNPKLEKMKKNSLVTVEEEKKKKGRRKRRATTRNGRQVIDYVSIGHDLSP